MIWPFRRKAPTVAITFNLSPPPTNAVMWNPGDVAECICSGWLMIPINAPAKGGKYIVKSVDEGQGIDGSVGIGLGLIGFAHIWDHRAFRKVVLTDTGADRKVAKKTPQKEDA